MKVFKFYSAPYYYAYNGKTEEEAKKALFEFTGEMLIDKVEEIPEEKWDDKDIKVHEDNDTETEPFYISIREAMDDNEPQLLFTNDNAMF
jgi:hypothetical protein